MITLTSVGGPISMAPFHVNYDPTPYQILSKTETLYSVERGTLHIDITGSGFFYNGDVPSDGTVTAIAVRSADRGIYYISGITLDAVDLYAVMRPGSAVTLDRFISENLTFIGTADDDFLIGGSAHDVLMGGGGKDTLYGGTGNDHIYGKSPGTGDDGDDFIRDSGGSNYIQGNAGNDTIDAADGSDRIYGGAGDDFIYAYGGNNSVNGNLGNDRIFGGSGSEILRGGKGDDIVQAGVSGYDFLYGDLGDDVLLPASAGLTTMFGGPGADRFFISYDPVFETSGPYAYQPHIIADFENGLDHIVVGNQYRDLSILNVGSQASLKEAIVAANAAMAHNDGYAEIVAAQIGDDTYLMYANHGAGYVAVNSALHLLNVSATSITSDDFIIAG